MLFQWLLTGVSSVRCASSGDWWYYGDRCQFRGSSQDQVLTAVYAGVGVLAGMLIVTVVSVLCVKKKYQKKLSARTIPLEDIKTDRF